MSKPEGPGDPTVRYTEEECFVAETERSPSPAPDPESATSTPLPKIIGPYRILARLGEGGMGDVLLAYDERLLRRVALKRIRPDRLLDEQLTRRFEIEARITARLQHPSILPVYHYTREGADTYYTMRPVEGITLAQLLHQLKEGGPEEREEWPTPRIVRLFLQASNAVAFAHARGVIHRDLKPSNIMIGPFEEVLVLDWGMAKMLDEALTEPRISTEKLHELKAGTESQILVGTPSYMAPEQFQGKQASPQSDQFALGLILYELLALCPPWRGESISARLEAMHTAPPIRPARLQPGRSIPSALTEVVLRALSLPVEDRYETVTQFSNEVAHALEGRAQWRIEEAIGHHRNWRVSNGRHSRVDNTITLRSRGAQGTLRYFYTRRLGDNVRVEFDLSLISIRKGNNELAIWLNAALTAEGQLGNGYSLQAVPGKRRTISLLRSGRVVAGAQSPRYETGRWHHVIACREDDRFWLSIDDLEIYAYSDPIPLTGGYLGFTGRSAGLRIRNLQISTLGSSARVSCLAVPDALFNRTFYGEAQSEYEGIAISHQGRAEGRLAQFRAGICVIRQSEHEQDPELRMLLLEEADQVLVAGDEANDSCLIALGRAMVASRQGRASAKHAALTRALEEYPHDPHLPAVHEWILGRLHVVQHHERQVVAELLPLAITHCMSNWGARVVGEMVRAVRSHWENPPFMTGRGKFKTSDPASHCDIKLLLAFWAGRHQFIVRTISEMSADDLLKPFHIPDAVFALLELQQVEAAAEILEETRPAAIAKPNSKLGRAWELCVPAVAAMQGELEVALDRFHRLKPDPNSRAYNGARLWLARASHILGNSEATFRVLEKITARDLFANEQRAWFQLMNADPEQANRELTPFIQRNDHLKGRNLSNLLHGVSLIAQGMPDSAQRVFNALDCSEWPRSWTLGSHFLSGKLEEERFLKESLPWERLCLQAQLGLAQAATGLDLSEFTGQLFESST